MNLARPFKAGITRLEKPSRRVATVESSVVADATEYLFGIGNRGLKATAKVMSTLRVENEVALPFALCTSP